MQHLRAARDLQLIAEQQSGYTFRHALFQEAFYGELLAHEERTLHARVLGKLKTLARTDELVMELAHHAWAARDSQGAASYSEAAGDIARGRRAYQDAARFYERALELGNLDGAGEAALFEKLGGALHLAAFGSQASRAFERALAYYESTGNFGKRTELAIELGRQAWFMGNGDLASHWRERALEITAKEPAHPLRFAALVDHVNLLALRGEIDAAESPIKDAENFKGQASPYVVARFHTYCGIIAADSGQISRMGAEHDRAISLMIEGKCDPHNHCVTWSNKAYCASRTGEVAMAKDAFSEAIRIAREWFLPEREAYTVVGLADLYFKIGDLRHAGKLLLESTELSLDSEAPFIRLEQTALGIPLWLRLGDDEQLERFADEKLIEESFRSNEVQRFGKLAAAFAELYATRGELDRIRPLLHRAVERAPSIGSAASLAVAVAQYGDDADLPRVRLLLERWAQPENRAGIAFLALFDALVARRRGAPSVAQAARAAEGFAAIEFRYYEALALETGGKLKEALAIYRSIGDVADARRLEETLNPVNRRGRAKRDLTAREIEVADLIAEGKSNKAIAEKLSVSERTVEHHVASILAKLEAGSRAQIAAAVVRERAGSHP